MKRLVPRLTYANVMATIAVFVALGGASYAATRLPRNSVGSKQIKKNAITSAKIKNGAVTGAKIKASSLGTVPSATHATSADSAASAASATSAANASSLGGVAAGQYVTAKSVLQSGATETGAFGGSGSSSFYVAPINFIPKVPAALEEDHTIFVPQGTGSATHCPGAGKADPGYLCAYAKASLSTSFVSFFKPDSSSAAGATVDGSILFFNATASGAYVRGVWAYTAP